MSDKLCKGKCAIWDNDKGTGWVMFDDDSGAASVCRDDLIGTSLLKEGDRVQFNVTTLHNDTKKAIRVKKCRDNSFSSHNSHNSTGILYFQTGFYNAKQMQKINNRFFNNIKKGPKMLFGDDYTENMRRNGSSRQRFGGQSKIMGHWDTKYGFGIPTSFSNSRSMNFIYNTHNFKLLMTKLFNQLKLHLSNGGDIVIPYPTEQDLNQRANKYYRSGWVSRGPQLIFHNLGTGISSLSFDHLLIIQKHIDELKELARGTKTVHQYDPKERNDYQPKNNQMDTMINTPKSHRGLLIFQTDWYNKQQMATIYDKYSKNIHKAPKMLFGDNDTDNKRSQYRQRQAYGGMAGVMGNYDRQFAYGIVTTHFKSTTPHIKQFQRDMDEQFKPLKTHLLNGYDVVVPKPSSNDIYKNKHRYYRNRKQVIFHNIGTGIASLRFEYIQYIQTKIDELKNIAKRTITVDSYKCQSSLNTSNYHSQPVEQKEEKSYKSVYKWVCPTCSKVMESNDESCSLCMTAKPTQMTAKPTQNKTADVDAGTQIMNQFNESIDEIIKQSKNDDNVKQLQQKNKNLQLQLNGSQEELRKCKMKLEEFTKDNSKRLMEQKTEDNYKLEQLQNDLKNVNSKFEKQKQALYTLEMENEKWKGKYQSLEQQLGGAQNELENVSPKFESQKKANNELQMENERLKGKNKNLEQQLGEQKATLQILENTNEKLASNKIKSGEQLDEKMHELKIIKLKFEDQKQLSKRLEIKNEQLKCENSQNEVESSGKILKFVKKIQMQQKKLQKLENENETLTMAMDKNENEMKKQKMNGHGMTKGNIDSDNDSDMETGKKKSTFVKKRKKDAEWVQIQQKENNPTDDSVPDASNAANGKELGNISFEM